MDSCAVSCKMPLSPSPSLRSGFVWLNSVWAYPALCPLPRSVAVLSENADSALLVAAVGVQDSVHENNRLQKFPGSNSAVEQIIKSGADFLSWSASSGIAAPSDWGHLSAAAGESTGPQVLCLRARS